MTQVKKFFASRSAARASGLPVKDVGMYAPVGKRWYVMETVVPVEIIVKNLDEEQEKAQDIFDASVRHLMSQKKKSTKDGKCVYRGKDGVMCAGGAFIAHAYYSPSLENRTVNNADVKLALNKSGFPTQSMKAMGILSALQQCHDFTGVGEWKTELKRIANTYNLNTNALDRFN